jgi:hypothetical protein
MMVKQRRRWVELIEMWSNNMMERHLLGDIGIDGKITLKSI